MSNTDTARVISLLLWIMLVVSALAARRMPWRQNLRMALAWLAIFATLFVIAAFGSEFGLLWQRMRLAWDPQSGVVQAGAIRVPMGDDGHFHVRVSLNGDTASFLVDSGATMTAISQTAAERANIPIDQSGFGVAIDTANGTIIARRIIVRRLEVGPITRDDFHAITAPEFGDTNVLGMNFLSSLSFWGVEGKTLVLKP